MKKIVLILILFTCFFLVSCSKEDPVVEGLIEYYNDEFIPIELFRRDETRSFVDEYFNISENEDNVSDETINFYHDRGIAIADEVIARLEKIDIKNDEVEKLNNILIEQQDLLKKNIKLTFRRDASHTEFLDSWNEVSEKYALFYEYLEELMEQYDLEFDEENKVDEFLYKIKRSK